MKIILWKYEIRVLKDETSHAEFKSKLNLLGNEGFEFVGIYTLSSSQGKVVVFKIPVGYKEV